MAHKLLISDLHLSDQTPDLQDIFLRFLTDTASDAGALYILGDLFDVWIGDDDDSACADRVRTGLRALTGRGVPVFLQHGNRDFLLGQRFCRETGSVLLNDTTVHDINGRPTLLMHGDLLCTDDHDYQQLRKRFRSFWFRALVRLKSLKARQRMADYYRDQSRALLAEKPEDIMDVNQQTVIDYMRRFQVRHLIHGHTHRPGCHQFELDSHTAERHVLPDWHGDQGFYMRADGAALTVVPLSVTASD